MIRKLFIALLIIALIPLVYSQEYKFYALSNDGSNTEPVYLCKLDGETGAISVIERFAGVVQGNYFALSNDNLSLLVTSKNKSNDEGGLVQYSINYDGRLVYVSEQLKPGDLPCHVSVTPDSAYALSANYGDDEISLYTFSDNELSEEIDHIVKADQSKGHYISTDPSGKFVHAVFLGLNKVFNYLIENNAFVENPDQATFSVPNGYGPRHMVFHPEKDFVYILNETHSSVTACSYNSETGALSEIQNISMLPDGYTGTSNAAAIKIHPNGNYLYASNRGHNSIVVYEITTEGSLVFIEHETAGINFPRDFGISPDGLYMIVANQKGTSVISLEIDESTGKLTNTGKFLAMQKPLAI
ncbi:MAG: lactonase family protein, partial [Bacteroides sp.]|nr:lactonase family protein [Bacteroides sp.]